jgi:dTDP-4-dehydrorhamnose 3,5-epimerase-like enzyme
LLEVTDFNGFENNMSIKKCYEFDIDSYPDYRGGLSVLEEDSGITFRTKRLYYLYNTVKDEVRGVHAHKKLEQIIIAISGKFNIVLDDGLVKKSFLLDSPSKGIYICPGIWREVFPIEDNSICLVLASRKYEEDDYIHDHQEFLDYLSNK